MRLQWKILRLCSLYLFCTNADAYCEILVIVKFYLCYVLAKFIRLDQLLMYSSSTDKILVRANSDLVKVVGPQCSTWKILISTTWRKLLFMVSLGISRCGKAVRIEFVGCSGNLILNFWFRPSLGRSLTLQVLINFS